MFVKLSNVYAVGGLAIFVAGWAAYILATALLSPNPPFVDAQFGAFLVVSFILNFFIIFNTLTFIEKHKFINV